MTEIRILISMVLLISGCNAGNNHSTSRFNEPNAEVSQTGVGKTGQEEKTDTAHIEFVCGWAGYTCPEMTNYQKLIAAKNYDIIKANLSNGTLTEKVLSAMAIQKLNQSGGIKLTIDEEKLYHAVTSSKANLTACYTCTDHFQGTIYDFFHPERKGNVMTFTPFGSIRDGLFGR